LFCTSRELPYRVTCGKKKVAGRTKRFYTERVTETVRLLCSLYRM
jgi:hypothetical protein